MEQTFDELVNLMMNYENLKRNLIAERFQFKMCYRKTGESISQYTHDRTKRTKSILQEWPFLDSMSRDRLVCGINHDRMQQGC